ncbi:AfsR/SARP family transcriptional regulator [Oceaniglobus ichthyenteri]|uniref:AfsR/SARP family transcriptional regulator n=1 Tax=Oceaniglobus ichthyenteri TaxID=2136177 RepID=UPI000D372C40|nr:hypothetical protein [Oceaniglobus ichthyenteri]
MVAPSSATVKVFKGPVGTRVRENKDGLGVLITQDTTPGRGGAGHVQLVGPLRVRAAGGRDCTPGGTLRKAMFAVLALSEGGSRSRVTLQDMFWSGRDPKQAGGSLRTALSVLRRELAPLGADVLQIDTHTVTLNCAHLSIDVANYRTGANPAPDPETAPDLLEGLDAEGEAREGFEEWLRAQRVAWYDFLDAGAPVAAAVPSTAPILAPPHPGLGLLCVAGDGLSPNLEQGCDAVLDFIGAEARVMCGTDIYDCRDGLSRRFGDVPGAGPAHLLQLFVRPMGQGARLTLKVIETATHRFLWDQRLDCSHPDMLDLHHPAMAEFISRAIEQLATSILPRSDPTHTAPYAPYQSLNMMFSLAPNTLERAGDILQSAWAETHDPVHLGLLSYLDTFRVGESWGKTVGNRPEAAEIAREGLVDGAFNGLYLTTAGYALFYLTDNVELAADLMIRAVEVAPAQALAWDHLALFWHTQGNRSKARFAAERAVALGRFSPLRFAYDTTLSMVAHAEGDFDSAISFGRRALARKPDFSSALRYVTAGLGLLGRTDEAEAMAQRILTLDPTFTADRKTQGLIKMADHEAGEALQKGLLLAGLK